MNTKRLILLITTLIVALATIIGAYYFYFSKKTSGIFQQSIPTAPIIEKQEKKPHSACLADNEWVAHSLSEYYAPPLRGVIKNPVLIAIKDKTTRETKFEFEVDNVDIGHYRPIELHKCGAYAIREFNYDFKNFKLPPGAAKELWRYDYGGNGQKILTFINVDNQGIEHSFFGSDFRIDDTETYIALIRSYLGNPDYSLVIKNLKTNEEVFILSLRELVEKYNIESGDFNLGGWGQNALQFQLSNINNTAFVLEKDTWKILDVFD